MPVRAMLLRSSSLWLLPITVLVVATINNLQLVVIPGHAPWLAAQKAYSVVFLGMITALSGAAEGAWLRRSGLLDRPVARGLLAQFGAPVMLAWAPAALALIIAVAVVGGLPAWQVWATATLSLLAWATVGMALGANLRAAIALPLAVVAAFGWFAFTPAVDVFWLRQLTGAWDGCCSVGRVPSTVVAWGIVATAAAITIGSFLVLWGRVASRRLLATGLAVGVLAATAGGVAWAMGSHAPLWPEQPRAASCADGSAAGPEGCA